LLVGEEAGGGAEAGHAFYVPNFQGSVTYHFRKGKMRHR